MAQNTIQNTDSERIDFMSCTPKTHDSMINNISEAYNNLPTLR